VAPDLPTLGSLDEVADLVEGDGRLFVRWSKGPEVDVPAHQSRDELTDTELPGLSANPLAVEEWWGDRPLRLWVARRLYDYLHLRDRQGPGVRPWVLEGEEVGRGPDNEPLVVCRRPVAWIDEAVVDEATCLIESSSEDWGPLDRQS
jgi:Family of unknown function (DUF6098)